MTSTKSSTSRNSSLALGPIWGAGRCGSGSLGDGGEQPLHPKLGTHLLGPLPPPASFPRLPPSQACCSFPGTTRLRDGGGFSAILWMRILSPGGLLSRPRGQASLGTRSPTPGTAPESGGRFQVHLGRREADPSSQMRKNQHVPVALTRHAQSPRFPSPLTEPHEVRGRPL